MWQSTTELRELTVIDSKPIKTNHVTKKSLTPPPFAFWVISSQITAKWHKPKETRNPQLPVLLNSLEGFKLTVMMLLESIYGIIETVISSFLSAWLRKRKQCAVIPENRKWVNNVYRRKTDQKGDLHSGGRRCVPQIKKLHREGFECAYTTLTWLWAPRL